MPTVLSYSKAGDIFLSESKYINLIFFSGLFGMFIAVYTYFKFLSTRNYKFSISITACDLALFIYCLYLVLNTYGLRETINEERLIIICFCYLNYILLKTVFKDIDFKKALFLLFSGLMLLSIMECLIGCLQYYNILPSLNEYFLVTGTFKNPAPLALFLSACYPLSLGIILFSKDTVLRTISIVNLILTIYVLFLTENRASWMAIFIISFVAVQLRFKFLQKLFLIKKSFSLRSFMLAATAFIILFFIVSGIYNYKPGSADSRFLIWKITSSKLSDRIFFGFGYGSFKENYNKWQIEYFQSNPEILNERYFSSHSASDIAGYVKMAYNEYLEILIEQGLVGFILFISLIVTALYTGISSLKKTFSPFIISAILSLISILITALVSYPFYSIPTFLIFFILLAIVSNESQDKSIIWVEFVKPGFIKILCAFLLIASVGVVSVNYQRRNDYHRYLQAKIAFNRNDLNAIDLFASLYPNLGANPNYLLDYGRCLLANGKDTAALRTLMKAEKLDSNPTILIMIGNLFKNRKEYSLSEEYYIKADLTTPSTIYPKYLLVKLYILTGQREKSMKMIDKILRAKLKVKNEFSNSIIAEIKALKMRK